MSTRRSGKIYRHEMGVDDHEQLLRLLRSSKAKIVLSGYRSDMYDEVLHDWAKDTMFSRTTSTAIAEETIWMNYHPPYKQLKIDLMNKSD